jgi:hypothetical protein
MATEVSQPTSAAGMEGALPKAEEVTPRRGRSKSFYSKTNPVNTSAPTPPRLQRHSKNDSGMIDVSNLIFKLTIKENISKELSTYGDLDLPDELNLQNAGEFEAQASACLSKPKNEIKEYRSTPDGMELLKTAILYFKYFERKEGARHSLRQEEFHLKCFVDDFLFHFLDDREPTKLTG